MKVYGYNEIEDLPENEWVECSEGLPPIGTEVIVQKKVSEFYPEKKTVTALCRLIPYEEAGISESYWDNHYGGSNTHVFDAIIRWKPMPKPKE